MYILRKRSLYLIRKYIKVNMVMDIYKVSYRCCLGKEQFVSAQKCMKVNMNMDIE